MITIQKWFANNYVRKKAEIHDKIEEYLKDTEVWFAHKEAKPNEKDSTGNEKCIVKERTLVVSFEIFVQTTVLFVKEFFIFDCEELASFFN